MVRLRDDGRGVRRRLTSASTACRRAETAEHVPPRCTWMASGARGRAPGERRGREHRMGPAGLPPTAVPARRAHPRRRATAVPDPEAGRARPTAGEDLPSRSRGPGAGGRDAAEARARGLADRPRFAGATRVRSFRGHTDRSRGHRPRLELVPPGRVHRRSPGVVEAHRRDLRAGAHRRGPGRDGRARRARRWRAPRRRLRCSRTSPRDRHGPESVSRRDVRDPRGHQPRGLPARARGATGLRSTCSRARRRLATATWWRSTPAPAAAPRPPGGGSMQLSTRRGHSREPARGRWARCA